MTHLTPDELIDAIEQVPTPRAAAHLTACQHCRQQMTQLSAVLRATKSLDVPEPSPLFWSHFSARVRDAVAAEAVPAGGLWNWMRWPVFAPLAVLALMMIALAVSLPRPSVPDNTAAVIVNVVADDATVDGTAANDGARWGAFGDLVGDLDWDAATAAGLTIEPGTTYRAVLDLTADERHELRRLLTAELQRPQS